MNTRSQRPVPQPTSTTLRHRVMAMRAGTISRADLLEESSSLEKNSSPYGALREPGFMQQATCSSNHDHNATGTGESSRIQVYPGPDPGLLSSSAPNRARGPQVASTFMYVPQRPDLAGEGVRVEPWRISLMSFPDITSRSSGARWRGPIARAMRDPGGGSPGVVSGGRSPRTTEARVHSLGPQTHAMLQFRW